MTSDKIDIDALLPLFQIRVDAHSLSVAKALGTMRAAEHLRDQIQMGLVHLPFHNTTIAVKVFEIFRTGTTSVSIPEMVVKSADDDLALKMALDELPQPAQQSIAAWIAALTPMVVKSMPAKRAPANNPFSQIPVLKAESALDASSWRVPRSWTEAGQIGAEQARKPQNMVFVLALLGMGIYKAISPASDANLRMGGEQARAPVSGEGTMFPGHKANPEFDASLAPGPVAEPLPTPQLPDPTPQEGVEVPKAVPHTAEPKP